MSDFKAKMHHNQFRLGLRPRTRQGSLQRSPCPLVGFKGPTSKKRGREGKCPRLALVWGPGMVHPAPSERR